MITGARLGKELEKYCVELTQFLTHSPDLIFKVELMKDKKQHMELSPEQFSCENSSVTLFRLPIPSMFRFSIVRSSSLVPLLC